MRLRRLALAALLAAALPARAAVPALPDADRTGTYTVSAPTSVFAVPFAVYGDCSDLDVIQNGTMLSPLNYTCASLSGATARPIVDMVITLATPLSQGTLQITGDYRPRNLTMPTAPGITRYEFNRTVNTILAGMRETRSKAEQAVKPQLYGFGDPTIYYPTNAVVGFGGLEWQASQGNVNQQPVAGSPYWQQVVSPPQQVVFNVPTLPGAPTPIAAAPTVDIGTSVTHYVEVTGAGAAISSFGGSCSGSAPIYYVLFDGANTLVHGNTLYVPGYAPIATAPNDSAVVQCLGNGIARVVSYLPFGQAPGFSLPSGAVMAFNLAACPAGWVVADGTNGVADARGVVIRGRDLGRNLDPNRQLGSYQADQLQQFTVDTPIPSSTDAAVTPNNQGPTVPRYSDPPRHYTGTPGGTGVNLGAETRMKNVALLYCQKT